MIGVDELGVINDNGSDTECLYKNNIVVGRSMFIYKITHKITWLSHDQVTLNHTEHISGSALQVMLVKKSADVAPDQPLVTARK